MNRRRFLQVSGGTVGASLLARTVSGAQNGQAEPFGPLSSVEISGATDGTVQGEFAYVAADDGFVVVDISTPESPTIVAERRAIPTPTEEPFVGLLDCWCWEDRLVIGGPGNWNTNAFHGFALYDIADPTDPERLALYETGKPSTGGHYIHNLYIDDGTVYLTGSGDPANPLVMVDITGDEPREVGRWSLEMYDSGYGDVSVAFRSLHDVTVRDGVAYVPCWDAGTWIVDVSDPADPGVLAQISQYELDELRRFTGNEATRESTKPPGNAHYTMVNDDGTLLAVGQEAWAFDGTGGPGGVDLYDVSTKAEPVHLARIDAPQGDDQTRSGAFTTAHNLDFAGDRLYTSWYYGGVRVHDISEPSSPAEVTHWQDDETSFWTAEASEDVFVATSADVSRILQENPPSVREALYVFPALSERTSVPSREETRDDTTEDGTDTQEDREGDGDERSSDGSGPGFGVAAAVGGALGGYYLRARNRE